ncbi:MAG TPA: sialidase family protein [Bryobacteraceae bacterium]
MPTGPQQATIYSDDHGKTWERGAIVVNSSEEIPNPSESMAVQLADGRVLLSIRNESTKNRRVFSIQPGWRDELVEAGFDEGLFEPICAASIVRFGASPADPDPRILFSNPESAKLTSANPTRANRPRQMLTIKLSMDDAKTWTPQRIQDPGVAGYSDLAVDGGRTSTFYMKKALSRGVRRTTRIPSWQSSRSVG